MLRQEQFDSLLTPIIYHHFEIGVNRVPSLRGRLFNVQNSTLSEEKGTGMGGIAPDAWDQYSKAGRKGRLDLDQLYTQTYTHVEYPVELVIEKRLLLNDQYGRIQDLVRRAGISAEGRWKSMRQACLTKLSPARPGQMARRFVPPITPSARTNRAAHTAMREPRR